MRFAKLDQDVIVLGAPQIIGGNYNITTTTTWQSDEDIPTCLFVLLFLKTDKLTVKSFLYYRTKLEDIKEIQKQRDRPKGVSSVGLALGKKITQSEDVDSVRFC